MSEGEGDAGTETEAQDIRISKEDAKLIENFISEVKKGSTKTDPKPAPEKTPDASELEKLRTENEALKDRRKQEILELFEDTDKEKYKDKSLADLELLLGYIKDHPTKRKGVPRTADSKGDETQKKRKLPPGVIGGWNPKTKEWE
jgi:hypothetical protein